MSHFERVLRVRAIHVLLLVAATRAGDSYEQGASTPFARGPRGGLVSSVAGYADVGGTRVQGMLNHCPRVTMEVTPLLAYTFQRVRVHSMSFDPEGDSLTYEWTARPDGSFASSRAILTDYRCRSEGQKQLFVRVTDARGCSSTRMVEVTCVGSSHRAKGLGIRP